MWSKLRQLYKTNRHTLLGSFIVNTGWLVVAGIYFKGIPYVLDILAARQLSLEQYGQLAFVLSFVALFNILFDFGINDYTVRDVAKDQQKSQLHLSRSLLVKFALGVINIGIIMLVIQFLGRGIETKWLVLLAALYLFLNNQTLFLHSFFRAYQITKWEALSKSIQATSLAVLAGLALFITTDSYTYLLAFVVSALIGWAITLVLVRTKIGRWRPSINVPFAVSLLRGSIPFALSTIFIEIYYYIDTVILAHYHGDVVAGYYKSAYNVLLIFTLLLATLMGGLLPIIARVLTHHKDKLEPLVRLATFIALAVIVPIVLMLYLGADFIVNLLYGESFAPAAGIIRILVLSLIPMYGYAVISLVLTITNRQKVVMWASIIGAVSNFVANMMLIPQYSYTAAAWTTVATELLVGLIIVSSYFRIRR